MVTIFLDKIVNKLINKGFKTQELKNHKPGVPKGFTPCITFSREAGSGGRLVASLVAKKLGMKFYDKEFVEMISKNANKRKSVVATLDERSVSFIEDIIASLASPREKMSEMTYFKYLCRTILSLAEKGNCVILGRGGNFIIPAVRCLKVSIIAPLNVRITNTMKYEKMSLQRAQERVWHAHFSRKDFIKRYFNKNISNANYYDIVINTANIALDQAVEIVVKAYKEKFFKVS